MRGFRGGAPSGSVVVYFLYFFFVSVVVVSLFWEMPASAVCLLLAVLLAAFAALRGSEVASDFTVYQDWYARRDEATGFLERPGYFEALYFLLNDIFAAAGIQFRLFIGFFAFVAVFIKTNVILSFSRNAWAAGIGILIYSFTFYLLHEFTQIRAGLAIAFIFLAVRSLVSGNRTHFALFVLLATGFHSSALMAFLLLLPHRGTIARWIDWGLFVVTGSGILLVMRGVDVGTALASMLTTFDPRITLYVFLAESGQSEAANSFPLSALLLLVLALSLTGLEFNRPQVNPLDEPDVHVVVLARRSILIGVSFLVSLSAIPELALRLFEFNIVLVPLIAAIFFSRSGWLLQKGLLLLWTGAIAYVFIFRDEGLVQPYVLFFS